MCLPTSLRVLGGERALLAGRWASRHTKEGKQAPTYHIVPFFSQKLRDHPVRWLESFPQASRHLQYLTGLPAGLFSPSWSCYVSQCPDMPIGEFRIFYTARYRALHYEYLSEAASRTRAHLQGFASTSRHASVRRRGCGVETNDGKLKLVCKRRPFRSFKPVPSNSVS